MTDTRTVLRQRLLQNRQAWACLPQAQQAQSQLAAHLADLLSQLEPDCLGLYWPIRGEFNPRNVALAWQVSMKGERPCSLALPWTTKGSADRAPGMAYRQWDGGVPATHDDCGIACPDSAPADPDVVLVPCLGFTRQGFRLGYGGGFFDRYLSQNPHVTAVGLAWSEAELTDEVWAPQAHDQPLMIIVSPEGVMGG